jgi:hypothetical protein
MEAEASLDGEANERRPPPQGPFKDHPGGGGARSEEGVRSEAHLYEEASACSGFSC